MRRLLHRQGSGIAGFTLAEVLIAALIGAFLVTAGLQLLINQSESHLVQAGITDMQQNGRASIDELVDKIRQAGYRLPSSVPALISANTNPDTIAIAFLVEPICTASLSDPMPQPSSELKCADSDVSCFQSDMWAYIHDPFVDSGEFFYITWVQQGSDHIQHNLAPLSKSYPAGSDVYMIEFFKYYVDDSDTSHPVFMVERNGFPPSIYADNIEDLQFKYVYPDGTMLDTVTVDRYVRKVEIDVMARTEKSDLVTNEYRRDTLHTTVEVRNLSL